MDYQTASIGITSLSGTNHSEHSYYLALWQGFQVGLMEDTLITQVIDKNDLSMVLFRNLNINKQLNYTIGLGLKVADSLSTNTICATLSIPAEICPPSSLKSIESGVCVKYSYAQSIAVDYWTPSFNSLKQSKHWISIYSGALSPKSFSNQQPIESQIITNNENYGTIVMEHLNLKRMSTYTVVYGLGAQSDSLLNNKVGIAAASFKTE